MSIYTGARTLGGYRKRKSRTRRRRPRHHTRRAHTRKGRYVRRSEINYGVIGIKYGIKARKYLSEKFKEHAKRQAEEKEKRRLQEIENAKKAKEINEKMERDKKQQDYERAQRHAQEEKEKRLIKEYEEKREPVTNRTPSRYLTHIISKEPKEERKPERRETREEIERDYASV